MGGAVTTGTAKRNRQQDWLGNDLVPAPFAWICNLGKALQFLGRGESMEGYHGWTAYSWSFINASLTSPEPQRGVARAP